MDSWKLLGNGVDGHLFSGQVPKHRLRFVNVTRCITYISKSVGQQLRTERH